MLSLFFVLILFSFCLVPTFASADDDDEPSAPPLPPAPPSNRKVIVRRDLLYMFQDLDDLLERPESNRNFDRFNNAPGGGIIDAPYYPEDGLPLEQNVYTADAIRRWTLRMWYGYGWSSSDVSTEALAWTIEGAPRPAPPRPVSPKPLFGYFPVTNWELDPVVLRAEFALFAGLFSGNSIFHGGFGVDTGDYFRHMHVPVAPLIYISDFGAELEFSDWYCCDETIVECIPEIYTDPWYKLRKSYVTFKKLENRNEINGRYSEGATVPELQDLDFEVIIEDYIERFLNYKDNYLSSDRGVTIQSPRRYYDYVFQAKMLDNEISLNDDYGFYVQPYEEALMSLPLSYAPVVPNIYIVDFSKLGIEEYYKIVSLGSGAGIEGFPDGYISGFTTRYSMFSSNYRELFTPFGYRIENRYAHTLWPRGIANAVASESPDLLALANQYRNLIFSNLYNSNYVDINAGMSGRIPLYTDFLLTGHELDRTSNIFFEHARLGDVTQKPYDPVVHLISDTELTERMSPALQFAEVHLDTGYPAIIPPGGWSGAGDDITTVYHNGNVAPRVLTTSDEFQVEVNRVWNIRDWFNLYDIPNYSVDPDYGPRSVTEDCLEEVFDRFIQYEPFRFEESNTWILDEGAMFTPTYKPIPVGGQYLPEILLTPDGDEWNNPAAETVPLFINALTELYIDLKEEVAAHFRTYREVMDGVMAYSEPLFYRLERRPTSSRVTVDGATGFVLGGLEQNFFFPASLINEGFKYVDSQKQYGVEYEYSLHAYYYVIGNEYWYEQHEDYVPLAERECPPGFVRVGDECVEDISSEYTGIYPGAGPEDLTANNVDMGIGSEGYDPRALLEKDWSSSNPRYTLPRTGPETAGLSVYAAGASDRLKYLFEPYWEDVSTSSGLFRYQGLLKFLLGIANTDSDPGPDDFGALMYLPSGDSGGGDLFPGGPDGRTWYENYYRHTSEMYGTFDPDQYAAYCSPPIPGSKPPWRDYWDRAGQPYYRDVPMIVGQNWYGIFVGDIGSADWTWEFRTLGVWGDETGIDPEMRPNGPVRDDWEEKFRWGNLDARDTGLNSYDNFRSKLWNIEVIGRGDGSVTHSDPDMYRTAIDWNLVGGRMAKASTVEMYIDTEIKIGALLYPRYGGIDATIPRDLIEGSSFDYRRIDQGRVGSIEESLKLSQERRVGCVKRIPLTDLTPVPLPISDLDRLDAAQRYRYLDFYLHMAPPPGFPTIYPDCVVQVKETEPQTIPLDVAEEYKVVVANQPHVVLVESKAMKVPFLTSKIVDSPPIPPNIKILPYRSVKDRALHLLNANIGSYKDQPIIIEDSDVDKFREVVLNQQLEQEVLGGLEPTEVDVTDDNIEDFYINFETDDYPKQFDVYRIDFPPQSYKDFTDGIKRTVSNVGEVTNTVITVANSYVDEVEPNKKYWYTFRVVDVHDNISNPTGIVQFEMVDTGNSIFPVIETYMLPTPAVSYVKPMKRYLMVSPASIHEELHPSVGSVETFQEHPLGEGVESSIWNKKYKLRITSKLTGKKVDINFSFSQGGSVEITDEDDYSAPD